MDDQTKRGGAVVSAHMTHATRDRRYALVETRHDGGYHYALHMVRVDDGDVRATGPTLLTAWSPGLEMPARVLAQMVSAYERKAEHD